MSVALTVGLSLIAGLLAIMRSTSPKHKKWIRVGHSPGLLGLNIKIAKEEFRRKGRTLVREGYNKVRHRKYRIAYTTLK
jgi:hypothetical protein